MSARLGLPVLVLVGLLPAAATAEIARSVVAQGQIGNMVRVESVRRDGDTVRLKLVNLTADRLQNVRVLVSESFRWKNEMHPGPDDPSQAEPAMVDAIEPGSNRDVMVTIPQPPLRDDGWFVLGATVVGLDAYPVQ